VGVGSVGEDEHCEEEEYHQALIGCEKSRRGWPLGGLGGVNNAT